MTPQEQALVDELFDRLAGLENGPRDPEAERVIADGLRRAPHAVYALVQTALVQDEALKRANARIEELQAQFGSPEQAQQQGGFLDSMREAVLGRREPRGSVPTLRSPATQTSPMAPPPYGPEPGYPPQMPTGPAFGSGGSFLGTAASTAAGVIGGALLMDGIRSMFGHHAGSGTATQSAVWRLDDNRPAAGSGSASDSNLAREAGINDVDRGGRADRQSIADADADRQQDAEDDRQQDAAADRQQDWADDLGSDDDGSFGGDDDSDFA
jgi:uncharacterized protein